MVVLLGPTGVGKTETIAQAFTESFEIIVADSMQVYRHLDIGNAKPGTDMRRRFRHHLLDVADPSEQFTCAEFVRRAEALIARIADSGSIPLVSGGTAYYLRSLIYGLPDGPSPNPAVRAELEVQAATQGMQRLHEELRTVDPVSAARIHAGDRYRILRALEIYRTSGRRRSDILVPRAPREDYHLLLVGLERDRPELYSRIDERVDRMFDRGLVEEVKGLFRRGYGSRDPGLRGIGYREFFDMRRGCWCLEDLRSAIKRDTRRYAKRQMTFFRSLPEIRWFHPRQTEEMSESIESFAGGRAS